eukprot:Transcript_18489.p1 GENE.Transcript_18489~~Transcript_18489.p1  ORF type:complete len:339 (+),score=62.87 Transcript_18489:75-1091(+)
MRCAIPFAVDHSPFHTSCCSGCTCGCGAEFGTGCAMRCATSCAADKSPCHSCDFGASDPSDSCSSWGVRDCCPRGLGVEEQPITEAAEQKAEWHRTPCAARCSSAAARCAASVALADGVSRQSHAAWCAVEATPTALARVEQLARATEAAQRAAALEHLAAQGVRCHSAFCSAASVMGCSSTPRPRGQQSLTPQLLQLSEGSEAPKSQLWQGLLSAAQLVAQRMAQPVPNSAPQPQVQPEQQLVWNGLWSTAKGMAQRMVAQSVLQPEPLLQQPPPQQLPQQQSQQSQQSQQHQQAMAAAMQQQPPQQAPPAQPKAPPARQQMPPQGMAPQQKKARVE